MAEKLSKNDIQQLIFDKNNIDYQIEQLEIQLRELMTIEEAMNRENLLSEKIIENWNTLKTKYANKIVFHKTWAASDNLSGIKLNQNLSVQNEVSNEVSNIMLDTEIEKAENGSQCKIFKANIEKVRKRGYHNVVKLFDDKIKELRSYKKIVKPNEIEIYWDTESQRQSWFFAMTDKEQKYMFNQIGCVLQNQKCYRYMGEDIISGSFETSFEEVQIEGHNTFTFSSEEYREVIEKNNLAA